MKTLIFLIFLLFPAISFSQQISGEMKKWHRLSMTFDGPNTSESNSSNPFYNYRFNMYFTGPSGNVIIRPGYFAASGNAANDSSTSGNKWRCTFTPNEEGAWTWISSMRSGTNISIGSSLGTSVSPIDGLSGSFVIGPTDKTGNDFRAKGMLVYNGSHYEIFGETGEAFVKRGPGSPENFLAYIDFDQTFDAGGSGSNFVHSYSAHVSDWTSADPVWKTTKGKGIIGVINYLSSKGMNAIYFIIHNRSLSGQGDGQDTWPWIDLNNRDRFDVSKLDQWQIVFDHSDNKGIRKNFLFQEIENQNDLGSLTNERKLLIREMSARFGHALGLQWNLGEEDSQSDSVKKSQADYIRSLDDYNHPITFHTLFNGEDSYNGIYGYSSFESSSFQGSGNRYDSVTTEIRNGSSNAGRKWIVYGDEQDPDDLNNVSEMINIFCRNIFSGGGGCEFYSGNFETGGGFDLTLENFRQFDPLWTSLNSISEFISEGTNVVSMNPGTTNDGDKMIFNTESYIIYLQNGGSTVINISQSKSFFVNWINTFTNETVFGSSTSVFGPGTFTLSTPFGVRSIALISSIPKNNSTFIKDTVPEMILKNNKTEVSFTFKNTGLNTWSSAQNYKLSLTDSCGFLTSTINMDSNVLISRNQEYTFKVSVDPNIAVQSCIIHARMKEGTILFGEDKVINYNIGPMFEVNFSDNDMNWSGFIPIGNGNYSVNEDGLCMNVPGPGDNIVGWISPERYVELMSDTVYHVRIDLSTDQSDPNAIPFLSFVYDNFNSNGYGNIYGGETLILDVGQNGGSNGIGRPGGRNFFDIYFAPASSLTPQWNGSVPGIVSAFDPSVENFNDIRFVLRVLDIESSSINAGIDSGMICLNKIYVNLIPISDIIGNTTLLFNDPINSQNYTAFSNNQDPLFAEINDSENTANYILDNSSDHASLFPGISPFYRSDLYPVLWETDTLYLAKVQMKLDDAGINDPLDALAIVFQTSSQELGQSHIVNRGSSGNMYHTASPLKGTTAGGYQTFMGLFYGQNVTNIPLQDYNKLRVFVHMFNTPQLHGTGTGSSMTKISNIEVHKVNF
jgi:hypothetical protein